MAQQTEKYSDMAHQVERIKNDFSAILRNTDMLGLVIQQIESAIQSIDHKNNEFNQRIESFYGALDCKIIDMENARQLLDQCFQKAESQMANTKQLTQKIFSEINEYLESSHSRALDTQKQSAQQAQQMHEQMKQAFEQTQRQLNDGLSTIENKLQQTLNQSLITLAQQLGSLSTKFAQDYEPITVNLKRVIDSIDQGVK